MIQFITGLGLAGFILVLVFLTKLKSLSPEIRAAIIGVRILLIVVIIGVFGAYSCWRSSLGQDFSGDSKEELTKKDLVGTWDYTYYPTNDDKLFKTEISFYLDGTFYDKKNDNPQGTYTIDERRTKKSTQKRIILEYNNSTIEYKIRGFDGEEILASPYATFKKVDDKPLGKSE